MQDWIDSVNGLNYPDYEIRQFDNSPTEDFMSRWKHKVPMEHIKVESPFSYERICKTMERMRLYFLDSDADYWLNIESDIIVPPDTIQTLLDFGDFDWISHMYAPRGYVKRTMGHFGCALFSRRFMEKIDFNFEIPAGHQTDTWLWVRLVDRDDFNDFKLLDVFNVLDVEHIGAADP